MQYLLQDAPVERDWNTMGGMMRECFSEPPWNEHWTDEDAVRYLKKLDSWGADFLVAIDSSGHLLGVGIGRHLSNEADEPELRQFGVPDKPYHIHEIMVSHAARGHGVATALVRGLLEKGRSRGCAYSSSRTRDDNHPMLVVFRKCGFKFLGSHELEWKGVTHTSVVYGCEL